MSCWALQGCVRQPYGLPSRLHAMRTNQLSFTSMFRCPRLAMPTLPVPGSDDGSRISAAGQL